MSPGGLWGYHRLLNRRQAVRRNPTASQRFLRDDFQETLAGPFLAEVPFRVHAAFVGRQAG